MKMYTVLVTPTANNIVIDSEGLISSDSLGHPPGSGPGAGLTGGAGGSHGGLGGRGHAVNHANPAHGNFLDPIDFGSGGSGSSAQVCVVAFLKVWSKMFFSTALNETIKGAVPCERYIKSRVISLQYILVIF